MPKTRADFDREFSENESPLFEGEYDLDNAIYDIICRNATFKNVAFQNVSFSCSVFENCTFDNATFRNGSFSYVTLKNCKVKELEILDC